MTLAAVGLAWFLAFTIALAHTQYPKLVIEWVSYIYGLNNTIEQVSRVGMIFLFLLPAGVLFTLSYMRSRTYKTRNSRTFAFLAITILGTLALVTLSLQYDLYVNFSLQPWSTR